MLGTQNQRELHLLRELTAGALRNMKGSKRKQKMAKRFINQMKENNLQHPQRQLPTYDSQRISGNLAEQSSAGGLSNQNQLHMLPRFVARSQYFRLKSPLTPDFFQCSNQSHITYS